ncbi:MAG: class B sortase [Bacilli bacterium]|nr:class B sortase [Bacilli bacterium]
MHTGMKRRKRKKLILKKWIRISLLLIFIILTSYFCHKISSWNNDNKKTEKVQKNVMEKVKVAEREAKEENTEIVNPPKDKNNDYWDYIKMDMLDVNFNELIKKNDETVGWIKVQGTNINYPVTQTNNNTYYLNHSYDKKSNKAGWVFADYRNNLNNLDKNTVIYAHGRVDTTMFGSLKNILQSSWYNDKSNHIIKFSTSKENTLWQVFSVYTIEAESYYITTQFPTNEYFKEFVTTLKNRSKIKFSAVPSENDKILTLSTCKDSKGNRVVMHAKLIKIESK